MSGNIINFIKDFFNLKTKLGILNFVSCLIFLSFILLVVYSLLFNNNSIPEALITPEEGVYISDQSSEFALYISVSNFNKPNPQGTISLRTPNTEKPITLPFIISGTYLIAYTNNKQFTFNLLSNTSISVPNSEENSWPGLFEHKKDGN